MQTILSQEALNILAYSKEESMRAGDYAISTDHIMLGIIRHKDNNACRVLAALGIDIERMKSELEKRIFRRNSIPYGDNDKITFARSAQNTLNISIVEATISGADRIVPAHLLLAVAASSGCQSVVYLKEHGIDHAALNACMKEHDMLSVKIIKTGQSSANHPVSILTIISSPNKLVN